MFCKNCGRQQQGNERFCAECGTPYTIVDSTIQSPIVPPVIPTPIRPIPEMPIQTVEEIPASILPVGTISNTHSLEEKRCPNCGANYTNTKNCEYCGSLLVRFVEHHIEIEQTKYGDAAEKLTGLEQALRENIQEQEDAEGTYHVTTSINAPMLPVAIDVCSPKAIKDKVTYSIGNNTFTSLPSTTIESENISLLVCFRFFELDNTQFELFGSKFKNFNTNNKTQLERLKQMNEFPLFTYLEETVYTDAGVKCGKLHSYYIDFGMDYKGAAAIITQYMREVHCVKAIKKVGFTYSIRSLSDEEYEATVADVKKTMKIYKLFVLLIGVPFFFFGGVYILYDAITLMNNGGISDSDFYENIIGSIGCILFSIYMVYKINKKK